MKKEKQELLSIRRGLLKLIDETAFVSRLSWRLNDLKNVYDTYSTDPEELLSYIQDLTSIKAEVKGEILNLYPVLKEGREGQNEE